MNAFGTAARRVALLVALVALSVGAGTALAAGGGEKTPPGQANATTAPGNSENASGHATTTTKKTTSKGATVSATAKAKDDAKPAAKSTAKPAAKSTAKPAAKSTAKPAAKSTAKPAKTKPAKTANDSESKSYKVNSSGTNLDKPGQNHRHTICHATGSATNPYVRISPSVSGVYNGHLAHQDGRDIIPPFTYEGKEYSQNWPSGRGIFDAGCATSTTPPPPPPPAGVASKKVTICHATGSEKNPFVILTIAESGWLNGHKDHAGDVFIGEGEVAGVTPAKCATTELRSATPPPPPCVTNCGKGGKGGNGGQTLNSASTPAQNAAGRQPGGVLGAQAALPANAPAAVKSAGEKPASGVLGAVKRLGSTAKSGTLPFTGLPLWVALASGLVLLAVGLGLRRGWART